MVLRHNCPALRRGEFLQTGATQCVFVPLLDDLKTLAADPWTEQDHWWYYIMTAQHRGVVGLNGNVCCFTHFRTFM